MFSRTRAWIIPSCLAIAFVLAAAVSESRGQDLRRDRRPTFGRSAAPMRSPSGLFGRAPSNLGTRQAPAPSPAPRPSAFGSVARPSGGGTPQRQTSNVSTPFGTTLVRRGSGSDATAGTRSGSAGFGGFSTSRYPSQFRTTAPRSGNASVATQSGATARNPAGWTRSAAASGANIQRNQASPLGAAPTPQRTTAANRIEQPGLRRADIPRKPTSPAGATPVSPFHASGSSAQTLRSGLPLPGQKFPDLVRPGGQLGNSSGAGQQRSFRDARATGNRGLGSAPAGSTVTNRPGLVNNQNTFRTTNRNRPAWSSRPTNGQSSGGPGNSSWFNGARDSHTQPYGGRGLDATRGRGGGGYGRRGEGGDRGGWGHNFRHSPPLRSWGHRHGHHDHDDFSFSIGFGFFGSCYGPPIYYPAYYPAYVPPLIVESPTYISYPAYVEATPVIVEPVVVQERVIERTEYVEQPPVIVQPPAGGAAIPDNGEMAPAPQAPQVAPPTEQAPSGNGEGPAPTMDDAGTQVPNSRPTPSTPWTSGPAKQGPSIVRVQGGSANPPSSSTGQAAQPAAQAQSTTPSLPPAELRKLMESGTKSFGEGKYPEAAAEFAKVADADPNNVDAVLAHAVARFATGDYAVGASLIRKGITLMPQVVDSVFDLRDRYGNEKDFAQHVQALEQRVDQHPEDMDAHVMLGFVYHFTGQRPWAAEVFTWVKQNSPADAQLADTFLNAKPLDTAPAAAEQTTPGTTTPGVSNPPDRVLAEPSDDPL